MKTARLYEIQVTVIYNRAICAVTSECSVKKDWDIGKQCRPDQTPHNAASGHDLHCLLKLQDAEGKIIQS